MNHTNRRGAIAAIAGAIALPIGMSMIGMIIQHIDNSSAPTLILGGIICAAAVGAVAGWDYVNGGKKK